MKKKTRSVHFYEMGVNTLPADNVKIEPTQADFASVLAMLQHFLKKEELFGAKASAVELVDFGYVNGNLFMLLNKVNPDLPEIGFYKTSTGSRRRPEKDDDESREQSAHIMVEPRGSSNLARVKITTGAGISAHKAKSILQNIFDKNKNVPKLKNHRKRNWPTNSEDARGQKREYYVDYKFSIGAEPSELLQDILDKQSVVQLDLVDPSDFSFDGTDIHISKRTFTIEGDIPVTIAGIREVLAAIKNSTHKLDVSQLRITYEEDESEETYESRKKEGKLGADFRRKEKKVKTVNASELEKAFTRSDRIHLVSDHPETQSKLSQEIMDALAAL
ncbi:hypothetical protein [Paracidovorax valerianellae]|uniref:Uncharacterized protein n=1 Tax=Paracidovorax valerianellae TaxID=187868 RepID=A0A1G6S660_9BURK|nr:hypothetical protein [Paracidovorax valerianellae]MDA8444184.1 hypothetical protein [Paracidovorax valerianellae]SDD11627.1 hypothetical protein SAMN05192589_104336 [Paracidovorax valerianellae]